MVYKLAGTCRASLPKDTLNRIVPLCSKLGITRIANIAGLDNIGIPVITCIRPRAKHLTTSQGKGVTEELATISAIMEAIEGFHVENAPPAQLEGMFSELCQKNQLFNPNLFVRSIFSSINLEHMTLKWIEATEIVSNNKFFIPHCLIDLDSTMFHPEYSYLCISSNGLAAGNTSEEAICHALYELIERDALLEWKKLDAASRLATQLDIESIDANELRLLIKQISQAGISLKVWDITSSIGIPAYQCAIYENNPLRKLGISTGSGAHLSKEIALSRAITEAVQSRVVMISGSRDDVFQDFYAAQSKISDVLCTTSIANGARQYSACISPTYALSLSENIDQIKQNLVSCGHKQILVFDHTKPEIDIPVVQVFVPGLGSDLSRI
ncbi:MAG: YcaO-like family protein [Gammaproteobacteria bacterium]|nr:YcaO-like family protein [Gammaproteobacteria bacterium]